MLLLLHVTLNSRLLCNWAALSGVCNVDVLLPGLVLVLRGKKNDRQISRLISYRINNKLWLSFSKGDTVDHVQRR